MKLTIIDKYVAWEILTAFLAVIFVLLIIVLGTEVVHLLSWVTQGIIPFGAFLPYLVNSLFEFTVNLIPLSLLMGILLALGRLYHDSEMTAFTSAGIGPMQMYRPVMLVAIPITVLLAILLLHVQPKIAQQRALLAAEVRSQMQVDSLLVGQFNYASRGGGVLFLESKNEQSKQIENVFFQQQRDGRDNVDLAASTGNYYDDEGRRYMMMYNGTHYMGNAGSADFKIIKYKNYGVYIDRKPVQAYMSEDTKSVSELWSSQRPADQAELQWRLTIPVATIIVAFMALPLSHTNPRSGRYAKLALALILYLVYSNLINLSDAWIAQQIVPVWIGTWWVHIIAIIITLLLLKHRGYLATFRYGRVQK
jgi:lipopolysaccharide export system permease protein